MTKAAKQGHGVSWTASTARPTEESHRQEHYWQDSSLDGTLAATAPVQHLGTGHGFACAPGLYLRVKGASTASPLNIRRADARRPHTHSLTV
jgi:hypothetical protein